MDHAASESPTAHLANTERDEAEAVVPVSQEGLERPAISSPSIPFRGIPQREDSDDYGDEDDNGGRSHHHHHLHGSSSSSHHHHHHHHHHRPRRVSDNSSGEDSDQQNSLENRSRWDQHLLQRREFQAQSRRALTEGFQVDEVPRGDQGSAFNEEIDTMSDSLATTGLIAASSSPSLTTRASSPSRLPGSPMHFEKDKDKDKEKDKDKDKDKDKEREKEKEKDKDKQAQKLSGKNVTLVIDGNRFPVNVEKLQAHPDTMLGRMFTSSVQSRARDTGEYVIEYEIEPSLFRSILGYYDNGIVKCTNDSNLFELLQACEYFMIPVSTKTIACRNLGKIFHYLSDNGAREVFVKTYLPNYLMPLMEQCALRGERQCFIVTLYSDDELVWDESHPPPFGEDIKKVIHNSELVRFLNFSENREIAKEVLLERGLKKVRVGIEGFPIDLIDSPGSSSSNAYRYEQRPYLFISWEKEEKSNRHVFFQHVKRTRRRTQSPPPVD